MKIRFGHVSNSSSSSFVIRLPISYPLPFSAYIEEHIEKKMSSLDDPSDRWYVEREDNEITCSTSMDNFDLYDYVTKSLGIPEILIKVTE